ncbi:ATP-binding protein [Breoghania sp.]|uniref:ATP-binding protein n=1 Tax=Breoghania sp. TaxID=2065378 RepID=UPI002AA7D873|nr:ATP-binding protein [Breoghania sp.]
MTAPSAAHKPVRKSRAVKTLGFRIAALLVISIVVVVGLATLAARLVFHKPVDPEAVAPVARQIHILITLAERDPQAAREAGADVRDEPARGRVDPKASRFLKDMLAYTGRATDATVIREPNSPVLVASVRLKEGNWLVLSALDFSPPNVWPGFVAWIVLIVAGSGAISVLAAIKVTRPLRIIEEAVESVGPNGELPHIREDVGGNEVRATARALNRLSVRLKAAIESRMRLVAAAGHDLRTPMTRMRLRAEFLPEEERGRWLSDLEELDQIADSAISLVREESVSGDAETVALAPLLESLVADIAAADLPVTLGRVEEVDVCVGPLALRRALTNLIVNAATHGGGASVTLDIIESQAVIRILDEGPGIPESLIDQIFEPFFRVDLARRKTIPGAGLGMLIAREIIERLAGTITIENRDPRGLRQTISFPIAGVADGLLSAQDVECT